MNSDLYPHELDFAMQLMTGCAQITRAVQQEHIVEQAKADRSPVTIADYAVQAYIAQAIQSRFPGDKLVGEESSSSLRANPAILQGITDQFKALLPATNADQVCDWIDFGKTEPGDRFWVLDPVDGTKGFLRRMQYVTALALVVNGEVVLGVLGCPELELNGAHGGMAYAAIGQGAWWQPYDSRQNAERLQVSPQENLTQIRILRSFEDAHTNATQIDAVASGLGIFVDPVRMDSQAKYVLLASGQADLLLRLLSPDNPYYRENIWDQAPAYRVLLEAGGSMTDMDGSALDFSTGKQMIRNRGIVASNGKIHEAAIQQLRHLQV